MIRSIKAAASDGNGDIAVMQLLLQQQGANALITEEIMKAVVESKNVGMMQLLLRQQGADALITKEVLKAATTDLSNSNCREVMLLLLDQPGSSALITQVVWEKVPRLRYSDRVTLLKLLLGKITITEEMTATFVRLFNRESVELLLDRRGADVLVTADVMKAALENANSSKELTLLFFNRYEREAYEALLLLGERRRVPFGRKGHLFRVKSSAGWVYFPLKEAASDQPHVNEVDKGLMTLNSSQGILSRFSSRVYLPSIQQIYHSIRRGLSMLPWIEAAIPPGHQRLYWRNVSTFLILPLKSFWMHNKYSFLLDTAWE